MAESVVTFVIPTYNRAHMLERAVRSVHQQSAGNWRIIICDNHSSDGTEELAKKFAAGDDRIRYFRQDQNIGPVGNFRYGMYAVDTDYFAFLSDDDFLLPRMVEVTLRLFEKWPEAMFAASGTVEVTPGGRVLFAPLSSWKREGLFRPPEGIQALMGGHHPSWTSLIFRTQVRDQLGCFYDDIRDVADVEYTFRIAARNAFAIDREPTGVFVRHAESNGDVPPQNIAEQYDTMIARLISPEDLDVTTHGILEKDLRDRGHFMLLQRAIKLMAAGDGRAAQEAVREYHKRAAAKPLSRGLGALAAAITTAPIFTWVARGVVGGYLWYRSTASTVLGARRNGSIDVALIKHILSMSA